MRAVALIIAAVFGLCSCSPRIYPAQRDTITVTRTERVVEYRDTSLAVPVPAGAASSSGQIRDTTDVLETDIAMSGVEIKDGYFLHWLRNKSEGFILYNAKLPQIKVTTNKDSRIFVRDIQVVEKELNGWQRTIQGMGYVFMGLLIAAVLFYATKFIRKI